MALLALFPCSCLSFRFVVLSSEPECTRRHRCIAVWGSPYREAFQRLRAPPPPDIDVAQVYWKSDIMQMARAALFFSLSQGDTVPMSGGGWTRLLRTIMPFFQASHSSQSSQLATCGHSLDRLSNRSGVKYLPSHIHIAT